jgi:uncharacterized protein (TIRG00374 family)
LSISDNLKHISKKQFFGGVISLLITLLFLFLAFRNVDLQKAFHLLFSRVSLGYFLLFIFLFLFTNLVRAVRWRYILLNVKEDVSLANLFGAMMIGYGVNAIVPRLGEFYRAFFLGKWEGVSRSSMFGTVIVERLVDLLVLFLSVVISVAVYSGDIYKQVPWLKDTLLWGSLIIGILIMLLVLLGASGEKSYSGFVKLVGKFSASAAKQLNEIFEALVLGISSLKGTKNIGLVIFLSVIVMLLYGLNSLVGFYMLDMEAINVVNYKMAWILMTISAFGIIIPTPGGIGSYHAIVIFVLTVLFNFGEDISATYAILTHFISYVGFISLAFFSIWFINRRQIKLGKAKYNFWSVLRSSDD